MPRIERTLLRSLTAWRNSKDRKPLILRGARQVGKTFLLKEFGASQFPTTHYFNFEASPKLRTIFETDLNPKRIIAELALAKNTSISPKTDLVIFDEVQNCPQALTSLKYFAEEVPELALCCAGSLLGLELTESSFPVGKVNFLEMHPLTFDEFVRATQGPELFNFLTQADSTPSEFVHEKLWEELIGYMITGGLPEIVSLFISSRADLADAYQKVRHRQSEIIISHIADMAKHCGKENSMNLERLWRNVPEQLAQSLDGTSKKFVFKNVLTGHRGYERLASTIDWLNKAGLISRVPIARTARLPLSAYAKESEFKLYMYDIGVLGLMSGLDPSTILSWRFGSYKGFFAENFVAQELIARGLRPYSWKENSSELEFLIEHKGSILPIEVKSGTNTRSRSLSIFLSRYKDSKGLILSGLRDFKEIDSKSYRPLYMMGTMAFPE